ncbi:hypothetical protein EDB19DRAFT_1181458 [Suillus lakei]|nr:hypothetical protein EDB19DRAFT_1181458 [Suillus lakei]
MSSRRTRNYDPMDGGHRAWATAFGSFLVQFCGYGYINSFGVYQDFYTRIYLTNQPPSAISWIGALSSFLVANITLISGLPYDRGWFHHLMIVGSSLQSLSLFALSLAKPGQFYMSTPTASYSAVARKCSREVPFILMTSGFVLCQIGFYFPVFYLQLDSIKHGIDVHFSFYSLVILNAASVIGRCTAGTLAAYTGLLNLSIAATAACGALIIYMISLRQMSSVIAIGVTYGYASGVYLATVVPLVTMLTPSLSELG